MFLKKLLIFTDFTEASSVAAWHCFQMASLCKAQVSSFHGVSDNSDLNWAKNKCVEQIKKIENYDTNVPFIPIASKQNLFKGINTWLKEQEVDLTFMATHGKKDIQFLTGSLAIKLINNAETPTIAVQHKTPLRPYRHILLPVFYVQSEMQFPVQVLRSIGSLFNSSLTLLVPAETNEQGKKEIEKTVAWLKEVLDNSFSSITVKQSDHPEKKAGNAIISAIENENIDLIATIIGSKQSREKFDKRINYIESILTNKNNLPVLCL